MISDGKYVNTRSGITDTKDMKRVERAQTADIVSISGKFIVRAFVANTFLGRLRGLHAFSPLSDEEALIIQPCNAIHTLTMRSQIDVVFVDRAGKVLSAASVPPLRIKRCAGESAVVEMSAGMIRKLGIVNGDVLVRQKGTWT